MVCGGFLVVQGLFPQEKKYFQNKFEIHKGEAETIDTIKEKRAES